MVWREVIEINLIFFDFFKHTEIPSKQTVGREVKNKVTFLPVLEYILVLKPYF